MSQGGVRARAVVIVGVLSVILGVGACGSSDDSSRGTSSNGSKLVVAVLANVSGANGSGEDNVVPVLKAWQDQVNQAGGVAGHQVSIDIEDTKGDPSAATAAANKIVSDKSVVAAVSFDANAETVYAPILEAGQVPVIGGVGFSPDVWGKAKNWLPIATTFPSVINSGFVIGARAGATRSAEVVCAEVPTCKQIGGLATAVSEKLGMTYDATVAVAASAPGYTAECLKLIQDNVDLTVLGHSAQVDLRFAHDCETQGYEGTWALSSNANEALFQQNAPSQPVYVALNSFPWWSDAAPVKAYRDLMDQAGVDRAQWADVHATAAYATMELFKKTLGADQSATGDVSRDTVVSAYGGLKDETLSGLLPQPITFTPGQAEPLVSCYWSAQFADGEFSGDDTPVCDPQSIQ